MDTNKKSSSEGIPLQGGERHQETAPVVVKQHGWQWVWPAIAILALILLAIALFMRPVAPVEKKSVPDLTVNITEPEEQQNEATIIDGYHYRKTTTTAEGDREPVGYKVVGPAIVKLDSYSLNPKTTRMGLLLLNGESFILPESAVIWEFTGKDDAIIRGESPYWDGFFRP